MSEAKIRQLKPRDHDGIMDLWSRAGLKVKPKGRESREAILRAMEANPEFFVGAEIKGKLVGVIIASSDGRKGYLNRIAVDPDYRGMGIAERLTLEAEEALKKRGIRVITLLVHRSNLLSRKLAGKLGYVEHKDIVYFSK